MSQAYLIADTKIHDPEKYESYKRLAKPIVEEFGGEYIIRGGRLGRGTGRSMVSIAFGRDAISQSS
jgi:uncharacterized protein (DUF1330 family)